MKISIKRYKDNEGIGRYVFPSYHQKDQPLGWRTTWIQNKMSNKSLPVNANVSLQKYISGLHYGLCFYQCEPAEAQTDQIVEKFN